MLLQWRRPKNLLPQRRQHNHTWAQGMPTHSLRNWKVRFLPCGLLYCFAKGDIMEKFKIARNNMICLHGFKIPESAVYGEYNGTLYVCVDLRIRGTGRRQHFTVYTYQIEAVRSVWTTSHRPVRRDEQFYLFDKWKLDSIPLNSKVGRLLYRYSLTNPLIIPRGEFVSRKSNEVVFRTTRPKYDGKRNKIPIGTQTGKVFA